MDSINPIMLRQDPVDAYRLGPGDTLGIYIESITGVSGVSGVLNQPIPTIPIHTPDPATNLPPATGYPFTVRDDGTISLPKMQHSLNVEGLTLMDTQTLVHRAYVEVLRVLGPDAVITVSLIRPRTYHVVVIREDVRADDMRSSSSNTLQGKGVSFVGMEDRGTARTLDLWAGQNDVLNALNMTGGMPSMLAKNEVIVLRGSFGEVTGADMLISKTNPNYGNSPYVNGNPNIVRIPLRVHPGQPLPELTQDDIILKNGDVVIVQSREAEVFYTGGMLQGGMYPIPRDFDLDVFSAISMAGGSVAVAAGGTSIRGSSIGNIIPPTRLLVIREVNGYQQAIRIDMKRGLTDPGERILIQPNDLIMLEYTPTEVALNMFLSTFSIRLDLQSLWN
ncbi:MAG: polysaccharide biosynthesis/export family protein [Planctomycetaceae bacterium]|nr:polysaccharide biosynthesis/export family protein [Planctomycetaceae bacterium]